MSSQKYQSWEDGKTVDDWEEYFWDISKSKETMIKLVQANKEIDKVEFLLVLLYVLIVIVMYCYCYFSVQHLLILLLLLCHVALVEKIFLLLYC